MATRFGRRNADGVYEYHDSKESLLAAKRREDSDGRSALFGIIGLLIGGVVTYVVLLKFGAADWPKFIRFTCVLLGAAFCAYVLAKFADLIWSILLFVIGMSILFGIGSLILNRPRFPRHLKSLKMR